MNPDLKIFMVKHGAIVTTLGAFSGLVYSFVLTSDIQGDIQAWHLAHLQGVITGILLIAASSYIDLLSLSSKARQILAYSFVITGYCYSLGPVWGAVFNVRGIGPVLPLSNLIMFTTNTAASITVLIGLGMTIYGAVKSKDLTAGV
jgi:hypothetical protein